MKKPEIFKGADLIKALATHVGLKSPIIKEIFIALGEIVSHQLSTACEVKIPYVLKLKKVKKEAKTRPAGTYPNFFNKVKDADGNMVPKMEYKEAKVIPAKTKIKCMLLKNIKENLK
jgi:hypothetical protein